MEIVAADLQVALPVAEVKPALPRICLLGVARNMHLLTSYLGKIQDAYSRYRKDIPSQYLPNCTSACQRTWMLLCGDAN